MRAQFLKDGLEAIQQAHLQLEEMQYYKTFEQEFYDFLDQVKPKEASVLYGNADLHVRTREAFRDLLGGNYEYGLTADALRESSLFLSLSPSIRLSFQPDVEAEQEEPVFGLKFNYLSNTDGFVFISAGERKALKDVLDHTLAFRLFALFLNQSGVEHNFSQETLDALLKKTEIITDILGNFIDPSRDGNLSPTFQSVRKFADEHLSELKEMSDYLFSRRGTLDFQMRVQESTLKREALDNTLPWNTPTKRWHALYKLIPSELLSSLLFMVFEPEQYKQFYNESDAWSKPSERTEEANYLANLQLPASSALRSIEHCATSNSRIRVFSPEEEISRLQTIHRFLTGVRDQEWDYALADYPKVTADRLIQDIERMKNLYVAAKHEDSSAGIFKPQSPSPN